MSFKVEVGGGGPLIQSSGVKTAEPLTLTLDCTRGLQHGAELEQHVRSKVAAATRDDSRAIRELGTLLTEFADLVWRVPEFRDYFIWLIKEDRKSVIGRLLEESLRRGRPRAHQAFQICAFMDSIMKAEGCSQHRAAELLRQRYTGKLPFSAGWAPSVKRIENLYSEAHERYQRAVEGYFVPAERLTTDHGPVIPAELRRR